MDKIVSLLLKNSKISTKILKNVINNTTSSKNFISNLLNKNIVTENFLVEFLSKHIREGDINIDDIEEFLPDDLIEKILKKLAKILNIDFIDLDSIDIDFRLASKIPTYQLKKN